MPRIVPSPVPRAPSPRERRPPPPPPPPGEEVALRLSIGREGIGLELARPARLGCVQVTELSATLPGLRFPLDVSGGVPRFRHRRGELQRLELELGVRALERWAAPRLRGLVGTRSPEVWVGVHPAGATVCASAPPDPEDESPRDTPVLAFDVRLLAEGGQLVLVVEGARGHALPVGASSLAVACVEALLGRVAEREGAAFIVRDGAGAVVRSLFPEAGARVPSAGEMRWTALSADGDTWILQALHEGLGVAPTEDSLRAREIARVLREADDALATGDTTRARALCVEALERAPRHPEIVRRIVDLDARAGGRAEAALATLVESNALADARLGTIPGELLAETGDLDAALASLERAGESETAPALGARAFEMAARLARDPQDAATWLDRAVARAPRSTSARWARVTRRLELGRLEDALADVEHLEAGARGHRAKHLVWLRAGRAWRATGIGPHAGALFERALRFVPDEPRSLAGLGAALVEEGSAARGVAVLTRALELSEAQGETAGRLRIDLGRALAESLEDLPTAIARVSAIAADQREAPEARGLEGRWRARLGDVAGASLSFARLREIASSLPSPTTDERAPAMAALLWEAAEMEIGRSHDALGAQRHLAAALRLLPRDPELLRAYRDVGDLVARGRSQDDEPDGPTESFPEIEEASATHRAMRTDRPPPEARTKLDLSLEPEPEPDAGTSARVEDLTRRLQGNPGDDAVADELLGLLETLGRGHELLALLSARLEDATPERRAELSPRARVALESVAARAAAAGRQEEASLFRDAIGLLRV